MKIAIITDTHWGARGDSAIFADYFNKFYDECFFPYLEQNDIKRVFHLGDIVDRRKYIAYLTARNLRNFVEKSTKLGLELDVLIGNHDTTFKNTNEVNSMKELFSHSNLNIRYYDSPQDIEVDGTKIAMLPWVCSGNFQESMEFLNNTKAQILFGHLEIAGFEMYRGSYNDHGFAADVFDKFDIVCSGHFHHKSTRGNINYLGAPYEMTWSDYDDPRGFHIFDTDTRELKFIKNPYTIFEKIYYRDEDWTLETVQQFDAEKYSGKYVKLVIENKTNPYLFGLLVEKIEKEGPTNLQVLEDYFTLNPEDEEAINDSEDTITILKKVVEQLDVQVDKKLLDNFLGKLYTEAMSVE